MLHIVSQTPAACTPGYLPKPLIVEGSTSIIKAKSEPMLFSSAKTPSRQQHRTPTSMWNEALAKFDFLSNGMKTIRKQIVDGPLPLQLKSVRLIEINGFEKMEATVCDKNTLKIDIIDPQRSLCVDIRRSLDLRLQFDRSFDRNRDQVQLNFYADSLGFKTPRTCIVQLFPPVGIKYDEQNLVAFILREEYSHRAIVIKIVIPTAMIYNAWKMKINVSMKKNLLYKHQDDVL
uniref:Uncharacterized protein n=1 Tax=Romanomermis culicivorax TaxID=13658 RepID=A0A915I022_ROMCU